jgi:hypothetical protein
MEIGWMCKDCVLIARQTNTRKTPAKSISRLLQDFPTGTLTQMLLFLILLLLLPLYRETLRHLPIEA